MTGPLVCSNRVAASVAGLGEHGVQRVERRRQVGTAVADGGHRRVQVLAPVGQVAAVDREAAPAARPAPRSAARRRRPGSSPITRTSRATSEPSIPSVTSRLQSCTSSRVVDGRGRPARCPARSAPPRRPGRPAPRRPRRGRRSRWCRRSAQPSGSSSPGSRIFSTTVQPPPEACGQPVEVARGSASPSGWSIRSPSTAPSRDQRRAPAGGWRRRPPGPPPAARRGSLIAKNRR